MLLEFKTTNYKSFANEAIFSMIATPKQKGLDYSLLDETIHGNTTKTLCSSVIYGPNASGKTNIIGAMEVFRSIIIRGNICNYEKSSYPNAAISKLELIPNNKLNAKLPTKFSITFIEKGLKVKYSIEIDFGFFLDIEYERKIVSEELYINDKLIYNRCESSKEGFLSFKNLNSIDKYLMLSTKENLEGLIKVANDSLDKEDIFLTNGFKLFFSPTITKIINDWFLNKFLIIYRFDSIDLIGDNNVSEKGTLYVDPFIKKAAEIFGINSNEIGFLKSDENSEPTLCSIVQKEEKGIAIPSNVFESYGTLRLINALPLIFTAIKTGATLIIDEFDASIHPMALMSIINIFHNDDINTHKAQLIFNTHNPIFLNSNLFRRDEIKFVDRDDITHFSELYALSDFGTSGSNGVRKNEDYMKNYFVNKYGAIKDIDFTPVFEELLSNERYK